MGRKYIIAGKYFFIFVACLIVVSISGCATLKEIDKRRVARSSLVEGERYFEEGLLDKALAENERVLLLFPEEPPGDEALFNIGLIYAHYDNQGKSYEQARGSFDELVKKYPESPLVERAEIWSRVLNTLGRAEERKAEKERETEKLKKQISALDHLLSGKKFSTGGHFKKAIEENRTALETTGGGLQGDDALFHLGLIYAHHENPDKDFRKSAEFFRRVVEEHPGSHLLEEAKIWLGLLNIIEKSKQVDIEIEKKKKELTR